MPACSSELCTHWPLPERLALEQRGHDAERREQARGDVGDRRAGAHRSLARDAGDRHEAAHALRDLVEARPVAVGAVLAEARDAGEDDARVDLARATRSRCRGGTSRRAGSSRPPRRRSSPGASSTSRASGSLRLSVIERLLRCRFCMSGPSRGPPMSSFGSTPGGDSILITSAPKSANWLTQVGPARTRERSRIRRRESAEEAEMLGMGIF